MADHSIPGPPPGRKNVPVHLTPEFRRDLSILMADGARASDVIRDAVRDRADIEVGTALHIPIDDDLDNDLATMARAGLTPTEAIRAALGIVAGTYANAWAARAVPEGEQPHITECILRAPAPVGGSDA